MNFNFVILSYLIFISQACSKNGPKPQDGIEVRKSATQPVIHDKTYSPGRYQLTAVKDFLVIQAIGSLFKSGYFNCHENGNWDMTTINSCSEGSKGKGIKLNAYVDSNGVCDYDYPTIVADFTKEMCLYKIPKDATLLGPTENVFTMPSGQKAVIGKGPFVVACGDDSFVNNTAAAISATAVYCKDGKPDYVVTCIKRMDYLGQLHTVSFIQMGTVSLFAGSLVTSGFLGGLSYRLWISLHSA
ncbi:hypothetical protein MHBO_002779 [Bonamia ostreae]|uniref:Uncharacterized protein n=1 Tax=Bonamia ostreae TaxID=126728 RepID=A0ABV2ANH2_9EUKA